MNVKVSCEIPFQSCRVAAIREFISFLHIAMMDGPTSVGLPLLKSKFVLSLTGGEQVRSSCTYQSDCRFRGHQALLSSASNGTAS